MAAPTPAPESGGRSTALAAEAALDRWRSLDRRLQALLALAAVAVLYAILYVLPGSSGWLHHKAPPGIIVLGIVYGTINAFGAIGLILIYRANRFINFAYGALGSMVGVFSIGLFLQHHVSYWLVLPAGVVVGAAVSGIVEVVIIRRFRNSSRLVLTVASIGLAQLLGGIGLLSAKAIGFDSLVGGFEPPLHFSGHIGVVSFGGDELLIVLVVPVLLAALGWFLVKTDAGMAVRAAAENTDRALLLGIPIRRLSTLVWIIAGALATLGFVLKAPFTGVSPAVATLSVTELIPPLAAAVVGRMESLPIAVAAGIGLGIVEQIVHWNTPGTPTFIWVVYLVVIVAGLLLQRGKLSRAFLGDSGWSAVGLIKPVPRELRHLVEVRAAKWILTALCIAAFVFIPYAWSPTNQLLGGFALVWAMVAVSLVILTGWGGHISLGQMGVAGVGAMVAGNLVGHWNTDFFVVLAASAAAGALVSLLVGLPALRIKGLFLAVTTLAFAEALDAYFLNQKNFPSWIPDSVDRPVLWHRFDLANNYTMYFVCLVFLGFAVLAARGVRQARGGRVLIATRDNERAADAASVPTTSTKLGGFALAGVVAGIAGAFDVLLLSALSPGSFPATDSIQVFCTAVIGGLGSILGALSGVLLFQYLNSVTALGDLRLLLTGAGLLFVLLVFPGGIGQLIYKVRDIGLRRIADRHNIIVPSLFSDRAEDTAGTSKADDLALLSSALGGSDGDGAAGSAPDEPLVEASSNGHAREKVGADR